MGEAEGEGNGEVARLKLVQHFIAGSYLYRVSMPAAAASGVSDGGASLAAMSSNAA